MIKEIIIPRFLNPKSIGDLNQQINKAEQENVRFIILKGNGTSFCEGLDIKWVAENDSSTLKKNINEFSIYNDLDHLSQEIRRTRNIP